MTERSDKPVILITGASSGIGDAIARRFAAGGYSIVALARRKERLEQLARELSPAEVETVAASVTDKDAPERAVGAAMKRFGRLDCLVNNAGSGKYKPVPDTTDEELDEVIDTSLRAPFRFSREAIKVMRSGSSLIHVGSTFGILGGINGGAYCAVKAGLIGMSQAIAVDCGASQGIRSNVVAPGVIPTEMTQRNWGTEVFRRKNQEQRPLDRDGTVEDVANLIFFLASPAGSYIQAQTIALDGGWSTTKYMSPEALYAERVPTNTVEKR